MSSAINTRPVVSPHDAKQRAEEYNFKHFRTKHLLYDAWATTRSIGVQPGQIAPDFTLHLLDGGPITLSQLRGRPVLLHFGSLT